MKQILSSLVIAASLVSGIAFAQTPAVAPVAPDKMAPVVAAPAPMVKKEVPVAKKATKATHKAKKHAKKHAKATKTVKKVAPTKTVSVPVPAVK